MDLAAVQREVLKMEMATPHVLLARLKEDWDRILDPNLHEEIEMEKKRWMIAALNNLNRFFSIKDQSLKSVIFQKETLLALYESRGILTLNSRVWFMIS